MRINSHRATSVMACTLIVLFFALSFNAYACLLPVNGVAPAAMATGCATPEEQPVSQYCDAFKTLSVQAADKLPLNSDYQALCPEDTASLALLVILTSYNSRSSDHPTVSPPQDLLLKISVLRI
ncbi:MAG: hypothetical protein ABI955_09450 [Nitrospirota bacterium]|jgi:hypothetical protein